MLSASGLEAELQAKFQLPHSTSIEVALQAGDLARVAAAINARIALRAGERINGMVEHVVGLHTELAIEALGELKVLSHGHIA